MTSRMRSSNSSDRCATLASLSRLNADWRLSGVGAAGLSAATFFSTFFFFAFFALVRAARASTRPSRSSRLSDAARSRRPSAPDRGASNAASMDASMAS